MIERTPAIFIAIPFYNCESFLDKAIISVVNQSYKNWKLVLIDDGSTDNSLSIARKYESDARIRVISETNLFHLLPENIMLEWMLMI